MGLVDVHGDDFLPGDPVTLEHLLTHTSGAADYFDGKVTSGVRVSQQVVTDPDRFWTPDELLAVSRERQRPVGRPGQTFHYSERVCHPDGVPVGGQHQSVGVGERSQCVLRLVGRGVVLAGQFSS